MMLDQKSLIEYRQRWELVEAVESAERSQISPTEKWQQLNSLMRLAITLDIVPHQDDHLENEVFQRWQIIYTRSDK